MRRVLVLLVAAGCARDPKDPASEAYAAPFAGVILALDHDHDGVLAAAEYPVDAPGALPIAAVDHDGDGAVSATEVRDAVYAVDPARFDPLAAPHAGAGGTSETLEPLAEALRFLASVQAERAPASTPTTREERALAATVGMDSPAGAAVLARFAAAGIAVPDAVAHAPADPPGASGARRAVASLSGERLRSGGPSGRAAEPSTLPTPPSAGSASSEKPSPEKPPPGGHPTGGASPGGPLHRPGGAPLGPADAGGTPTPGGTRPAPHSGPARPTAPAGPR